MWEQIRSNRRKSIFLISIMATLLVVLGYLLAEYLSPGSGPVGVVGAVVVWLIMLLVTFSSGNQILLTMSGAHKIEKKDLPQLWNIVEEMSIASGLPKMPDIYLIDDPAPNAFATGRKSDQAAVAVTAGLLRICSRDELQGVIAHELGHIKNRDVALMLVAGIMVGAIVLIAEVGMRSFWFGGGRSRRSSDGGGGQFQILIVVAAILAMILAPLVAQLIYFSISRKREYLADASAARYTRYPEGLASALEKIAAAPDKVSRASRVTAPMYIINPLARRGSAAADLSSTHPPTSERVRILRSMGGASFADYNRAYEATSGKRRGPVPGSALTDDEAAPLKRAPEPQSSVAPASAKARAREVDNLLYEKSGYQELNCPCGTILKIPPDFAAQVARCPHCGREHALAGFHGFS